MFLAAKSFCQDSIYISNEELKKTCLIFLEHEKLSIENPLLKQQILSLEELNQVYIKSDSLQKEEIQIYKDKVISNEETIKKLKINQKNTVIGSSISGILLFILGLIL